MKTSLDENKTLKTNIFGGGIAGVKKDVFETKCRKIGGGKRKTTRSRKNGGNDVSSLEEKNKDQGGTNINILPGSGGAKKKNKKRNTKKRSSKTKGGFWPFTKKEEPKLDGVGPPADPPAAAAEEKQEPTTQGKIKYPMMTLSYGGNSISCDVCKNNKYYKMDMSISRSKVASITSGIILINGVTDIISHPVKCYLCTTCLNCRFVYATTTWNKLKTVIQETKVDV
jgi:hypothetical protein